MLNPDVSDHTTAWLDHASYATAARTAVDWFTATYRVDPRQPNTAALQAVIRFHRKTWERSARHITNAVATDAKSHARRGIGRQYLGPPTIGTTYGAAEHTVNAFRHMTDPADDAARALLLYGGDIGALAPTRPMTPTAAGPRPRDTSAEALAAIEQAVSDELRTGSYAVAPTAWAGREAPLFPREKKTPGTYRALIDHSDRTATGARRGTNGLIIPSMAPDPALHYISHAAAAAIEPSRRQQVRAWFAAVDIKAAFRQVPVRAVDQPLLMIRPTGHLPRLIDRRAPMGLTSSCGLLAILTRAACRALERQSPRARALVYVDDFLIVARTREDATHALSTLRVILGDFGLPIADDKTTTPTKVITWIGHTIDAVGNTITAATPIRDKTAAGLRALSRRGTALQQDMRTLGRLAFILAIHRPIRAIAGPIIGITPGAQLTPDQRESANDTADAIDRAGYPLPFCWTRKNTIDLVTDASATAYGYWYRDGLDRTRATAARGTWVTAVPASVHSELATICVAIHNHGRLWRGRSVIVHTDSAVTQALLTRFATRTARPRALLLPLIRCVQENEIHMRARHVAGDLNILADALSRQPSWDSRRLRSVFARQQSHFTESGVRSDWPPSAPTEWTYLPSPTPRWVTQALQSQPPSHPSAHP